MTMISVQHFHSPIYPILSHPKYTQQLKHTAKLLWLTSNQPTSHLYKYQNTSLKTKAVTNSLALGVSSVAKPADISILLQTSAVLLFVYWIANFIVPDIILKDLQSNQASKEQKPNDDDT
ncbi:hypothetical protein LOK49_LG07G03395 [Camellia lanceoleosa]|uniref:Uncharacterized protein n=1 Tax=Camellia lanceoleosa TaxID=1840588 RepID=A0ACC0GZT6_9ERIC|nr:hypothetical protein LOK49_LG07G03395 [Camellia lanceoleosa]